jgi:hypothetical protein
MQEDEISLIDLLLLICENIKLLIIGPFLVYIVTLGVLSISPQKYVSKATINLSGTSSSPTLVAALMKTGFLLDPIIESQGFVVGESKQIARDTLASQIKTGVDKTGLLQLEVTADTNLAAQELCAKLIEGWLKSTEPPNHVRQKLEKKLLFAEKKLMSVSAKIDLLEAEISKSKYNLSGRSESSKKLLELIELYALYSSEVDQVSIKLNGHSHDVIIQNPTLPLNPDKNFEVTLPALGAFLMLLFFVFLRQAWRKSAADPVSAQKQLRLLKSLGFKFSGDTR